MENNERYCPYCNTVKPIKDFYIRYGVKNQYLPNCISCTNSIYKTGMTKYNHTAAGIWAASMANNVPFIRKIYEDIAPSIATKEGQRGRPPIPFATYYNKMKEYGQIYHGVIDSDITLADYVEFGEKIEEEEEPVDYSELIKIWGRFVTKDGEVDEEAYEFLENLYAKYTENLLQMDTAMEQTYRDLCIAHWQKRKADEGGDMAEVEKARKQINQNLALLKLDKFQTNTLSDEEKHIEYICWEIENTTPAECEDLEKYKDFSGFEKPFAEIMRCVKNLVAGSKEYPDLVKEDIG